MASIERKTVGVLGGMGPEATVDFMAKVIAMTDSDIDQDHVHMIVDQNPTVPDRQAAIRAGRDDVAVALGAMARKLEDAGADFLVMICNTAHVFQDAIRDSTRIPFISIIDESVAAIERSCPAANKVGVMATPGCLDTGIYQAAIRASGREALVPEGADIEALMELIRSVKAGDKSARVQDGMLRSAVKLVERGAEVIIAGCTEIPIVFSGAGFRVPVVSSTDVLAARTVQLARGEQVLP
jgi:aspartate racemase